MIVKFANIAGLGLHQDVAPNDCPAVPAGAGQPIFAWTGGMNMRFRDGYAEKFLGHTQPNGAPTVTPYGVFFTNTTSGLYTVYTGLTKIYAVTNTTHSNITRAAGDYTGTSSDKWNGCTLSDILIVNNGVDDPQFWGGGVGTPMAKLTNWPVSTKCKVMRSFAGALVALNITEGSSNYKCMVRVSTSADPGTLPASWDYTSTSNDSVRVEGRLSETPDAIVDGLALGDVFMIYKENSTYSMRFTGGEDVYSFDLVTRESGALAVNCVTEFEGGGGFPAGHAVFADGDLVINTGVGTPVSIVTQRWRRWLFNNLDSDNRQKSFVVTNKHCKEVWFCFPSIGSTWCDQALVWNYGDNTLGQRQLPNLAHANAGVLNITDIDTWDSRTDTWDEAYQVWGANDYSKASKRLIMGSTDGGLYLADSGISFNGSPMTAYMEHTGMDFKEIGLGPERVKWCSRVRMRVDAQSGTALSVWVGSQDNLEDPINWGTMQTFTVGASKWVEPDASGAFLSIKFQSIGATPWRIAQFEMDIEDVGEVENQ